VILGAAFWNTDPFNFVPSAFFNLCVGAGVLAGVMVVFGLYRRSWRIRLEKKLAREKIEFAKKKKVRRAKVKKTKK